MQGKGSNWGVVTDDNVDMLGNYLYKGFPAGGACLMQVYPQGTVAH